jgi:putative tryptophan/tyrosine transport system substrate-binding protein
LFTLLPRFGMLMAYGPHLPDMYRRAGTLIDRIFKGAIVAETPIERPTRFNLKTGKALGLTISPTLLVRADEVIE